MTLGATPGLAVARMRLLSATCDVYLSARSVGLVTPLSVADRVLAGGQRTPRSSRPTCASRTLS